MCFSSDLHRFPPTASAPWCLIRASFPKTSRYPRLWDSDKLFDQNAMQISEQKQADLIKMDVLCFFFSPLHGYYDAEWDPDPLLWEAGRGTSVCGGSWSGRSGGEQHAAAVCYWGKLHHRDLHCDSIYIEHNNFLFLMEMIWCSSMPVSFKQYMKMTEVSF